MKIEGNYIVPGIKESDIAGFCLTRSPVDKRLFNVYACNSKDELLFSMWTDMQFEEAANLVETLNTPYESEVEDKFIQHETREVEMQDGSVRYYQVQV